MTEETPVQKLAPPQVAAAPKLTKEQRSQIAKDAAQRRWAKEKRDKAKAQKNKTRKSVSAVKGKKKPAGPREFTSALKTAEKRLARAIQERAEAGAKYAIASAEIPSLQRLIAALRNDPIRYNEPIGPAPSLEQIVGDPAVRPTALHLNPATHPVTAQGRAQGGAIGVALEEEPNENAFLETSGVAAGDWH